MDSESLSQNSYIVDENSAQVEAADEVLAVSEAQRQLEEMAAKDKTLLANAQQRAKSLLEEYIKNIGEAVGEEYKIDWIYVDASGNPLGTAADASAETAPQTFDMGIIAAAAAVVSLAGYAVAKKH